MRGEQAFKTDRHAEAAAWFVKGRDYLRAAELYESVGMMAEAAGAYEAGESWAAAGGVYIRAGLADRAAGAYEKAGELETAASLYQKLGDVARAADLYGRAGQSFKSGEAPARAGEREKAIALLQRVVPGDENHRAATELLARLFIETGRPALAMERVRKAIAGEAISAGNLDLYYWMALAHEAAGAPAEALALYKKMQAEDLQFRDVNQRVARLSAEAPAAVPAPAPPPNASAAVPAAAAPPPPAAPAARPPRFVPREEIARGPLGAVWRGEDTHDGRSVAMRMFPRALLAPAGLLPALAADLKAAFQISHPNLVKVIAFMDWKGERCLVTELVTGRNFAEAIASGRRLSFQQVHALGRVVAQVLGFVHEKGLVHGSVRPSNVMVASGVIKLADLGLGRLAQTVPAAPGYHAPEGGLSPADDLYALSAVMYHLLTGTHPLSQPQGVGLPLPSQLAPGVPEAMDKLLLRGLHPRPELRLASAADLVARAARDGEDRMMLSPVPEAAGQALLPREGGSHLLAVLRDEAPGRDRLPPGLRLPRRRPRRGVGGTHGGPGSRRASPGPVPRRPLRGAGPPRPPLARRHHRHPRAATRDRRPAPAGGRLGPAPDGRDPGEGNPLRAPGGGRAGPGPGPRARAGSSRRRTPKGGATSRPTVTWRKRSRGSSGRSRPPWARGSPLTPSSTPPRAWPAASARRFRARPRSGLIVEP